MPVTHILFDCDNTLVLSEHHAFTACTSLINEILSSRHIPKNYTPSTLIQEFVGMNFRGMVVKLSQTYSFSISDAELDLLVKEEEDRVISVLEKECEACEGVDDVLKRLFDGKKYGLALRASMKKVDQLKYFPDTHIFSAATSLPVPTSKPDPAVYMFACETVGKSPAECVAVEDSRSGTLSAVRAGITVVGYVGSYEADRQKEMTDVLLEAGCKVVMTRWSQFEDILASL
ncbi:HAD-like domain-containing protein [Phlyctochytrium arcticum]|nr:HAD-like domain-containing protein [Phlyctochytrium arcticum]